MPFESNLSAAPSKLPAITTTEVVPSPASTSWAALRSTSILAAGCMTLMPFNIVLPSFVCYMSNFFLLSPPGMAYNDSFAFTGLYLILISDRIPDQARDKHTYHLIHPPRAEGLLFLVSFLLGLIFILTEPTVLIASATAAEIQQRPW